MRVLTSSIKKNLPNDLIVLIWKFYDEAYFGIQFDDFQFFKIENSEERTTIKMWQEEPLNSLVACRKKSFMIRTTSSL